VSGREKIIWLNESSHTITVGALPIAQAGKRRHDNRNAIRDARVSVHNSRRHLRRKLRASTEFANNRPVVTLAVAFDSDEGHQQKASIQRRHDHTSQGAGMQTINIRPEISPTPIRKASLRRQYASA
jgi:hypothetical protein